MLGEGWRIPTSTEWKNVDNNGKWNNMEDAFALHLKLQAAGYLNYSDGLLLNRGVSGTYRCSDQENATTAHYSISKSH